MSRKINCIAIFGLPNAGKSTLMNALMNRKVSIITHKVQTTRDVISGVLNSGDTQLVFMDTPGVCKPRHTYERDMVRHVWYSLEDSDMGCMIVDVKKGLVNELKSLINRMKTIDIPHILVLNKIDLIPKKELLSLIRSLNELYEFKEVFMISALKKDGIEDLKKYFFDAAVSGEWMYESDNITRDELFVAEITREKVFLNLHDELPYQMYVNTKKLQKKVGNTGTQEVFVWQDIVVISNTHRKMVLGAKGSMIKKIGEDARKELERLLDNRVHLFLNVEIKKDWCNN